MNAIRKACVEDFRSIVNLLQLCFRTEGSELPSFDCLYPDVYNNNQACIANIYVIEESGVIVACLLKSPIQIFSHDVFKIYGIGGVCANPEYRGKGLMSSLFEKAMIDMVDEKTPIAWLSGDRNRYSHWGFETFTANKILYCSKRNIDKGIFEECKIKEGFKESNFESIYEQSQMNSFLKELPKEELLLKYKRYSCKLFSIDDFGGAHLLLKNESQIVAWGGNQKAFKKIFHSLLNKINTCSVQLPLIDSEYNTVFEEAASRSNILDSGNICIINLYECLKAYQSYLNDRIQEDVVSKKVILHLKSLYDFIPDQRVYIEMKGNELFIKEVDGSENACEEIVLDSFQMVEFMFSEVHLNLSKIKEFWLSNLFPLPFYLSPIHKV